MTHRNFNDMLVVFIVVLASYILIAPLLPQIDFIMNKPASIKAPAFMDAPISQTANSPDINTASGENSQTLTQDTDNNQSFNNQLYIPSIGAIAPVLEGLATKTVDKGLWHRPASSEPGKGGNTVIVGHRFSYNHGVVQPFYHLDKVKLGDKIYVYWDGKKYSYNVVTKKVVKNTEISVEAPANDEKLTLYTCTPLLNPKDRLVIIATPTGGVL